MDSIFNLSIPMFADDLSSHKDIKENVLSAVKANDNDALKQLLLPNLNGMLNKFFSPFEKFPTHLLEIGKIEARIFGTGEVQEFKRTSGCFWYGLYLVDMQFNTFEMTVKNPWNQGETFKPFLHESMVILMPSLYECQFVSKNSSKTIIEFTVL